MKEYKYRVCLCDGYWCSGAVKVKADNKDDAYDNAMDYILSRLANALPELDIEVYIEQIM